MCAISLSQCCVDVCVWSQARRRGRGRPIILSYVIYLCEYKPMSVVLCIQAELPELLFVGNIMIT